MKDYKANQNSHGRGTIGRGRNARLVYWVSTMCAVILYNNPRCNVEISRAMVNNPADFDFDALFAIAANVDYRKTKVTSGGF